MKVDRYAVIGCPVAHSLSPRIHRRFAEQTGEALIYEAIEVPPERFDDALAALQSQGYRGLNVTVPLKALACAAADRRDAAAQRAGAVNTLRFEADGTRSGFNTDGIGLRRDLERLGLSPAGRRVLVVGAGGAVRGVLGPLLEAGPARLRLANRDAAKARALARTFADLGPVTGGGLDEAGADAPYDLIVHGTAAGHHGHCPPLPDGLLAAGGAAYDLSYGAAARPFLDWARRQGAAHLHDGLGMLVEQAAEAFCLWRGRRPDTAAVLAELEAAAG